MKPRIYLTEPEEIDRRATALLTETYDLIDGDIAGSRGYDPEAMGLLIQSRTTITQRLLNRFPALKAIIRASVGLETIDMEACLRRGIAVFDATGANSDSVAEYVVGMMITALRKWNQLTEKNLKRFQRFHFMGKELRGRRIGLVGFGNIGRKIFERLSFWGVKEFMVYDPYIDPTQYFGLPVVFNSQLPALLRDAEITSIQVPFKESTHHLISQAILEGMQPGAILLNVSRGGIVDEKALLKILEAKHLTYVADSFETEPTIRDELFKSAQVIATPHIASMTFEAHEAMAFKAIHNFIGGNAVTSDTFSTHETGEKEPTGYQEYSVWK